MSEYGQVLVLYQISNEFPPSSSSSMGGLTGFTPPPPSYNAFQMSRKGGVTLNAVKRNCLALRNLNPLGPDGYHWRVRIDEKPNTSHSSNAPVSSLSLSSSPSSSSSLAIPYSWWDVQDENARLPVKEATPNELKRMFSPKCNMSGGYYVHSEGDVTQEMTKAAKGAMKYVGKAMNAVAASASGGVTSMEDDSNAIRTPVICFKLLDLEKVRRGFGGGGGGGIGIGGGVVGVGRGSRSANQRSRNAPARSSSFVSQTCQQHASQHSQQPKARAPASAGAPRVQRIPPPHSQQQQQGPPAQPIKASQPSVARSTPPTNLMDFGTLAPAPAATRPAGGIGGVVGVGGAGTRTLHHAASMPAIGRPATTPTGALPNETRAEKLKREYAEKAANSNRVWDDVDQRWVEGPVQNGETKLGNSSNAPGGAGIGGIGGMGGIGGGIGAGTATEEATSSLKGISLSTTNAIGKSASVQAAVHARVASMEASQQKAIDELRTREHEKQRADAEEDVVRQRLEPKLKAWSEEHGKKKQLRALLANLHTILWEDAGWKPVSLADVLEDGKVKRVYHRASRVVHPDKTGHLDAEKRFVAKRVFDALTQAKVEFDEGAK